MSDRDDRDRPDPADEAFLDFMRLSERDPDFDVSSFLHAHTGDGELREAIGVLGTLASVAAPDEGPPPDPCLQEPLDGRYRIERFLASGGMGDVYLAKDLRTDASVVIKILNRTEAELRHRFRREVQLTAALSHRSRHIVRVNDIAELSDGRPYLVMEYLEGRSLEKRLATGPLSVVTACRIVREIAVTLDIVHSLGVAHGDIKPGNVILIRRGGEDDDSLFPVLIDFGVARVRGPLQVGPETQEGIYRGTLRYAAPESLDGTIDALTDQLALGVMAYEMLSGKHPFPTLLFTELTKMIQEHRPPRLDEVNPAVPRHVADAVSRAMEKRREDRFQNMREFAAMLDAAASSERREYVGPLRPQRNPKDASSTQRVGFAGVIFALALTAGIATAWWGSLKPPTSPVVVPPASTAYALAITQHTNTPHPDAGAKAITIERIVEKPLSTEFGPTLKESSGYKTGGGRTSKTSKSHSNPNQPSASLAASEKQPLPTANAASPVPLDAGVMPTTKPPPPTNSPPANTAEPQQRLPDNTIQGPKIN